MKYIDADKLRAEIAKRISKYDHILRDWDEPEAEGRRKEAMAILTLLDTLEEPVNDDLEEAVEEFYPDFSNSIASKAAVDSMRGAFKAGAKWQEEQDKKTIELAEDHAYFAGGINEREKMMAGAVEGEVCYGSEGAYIETDFLGEYDTDVYGNPGDKVKIIVVKED